MAIVRRALRYLNRLHRYLKLTKERVFGFDWFRCLLCKKEMTEYYGEFGYELISVIPYAFWLYLNNKLCITKSVKDSKAFYYFSPRHKEVGVNRTYSSTSLSEFPITNIHVFSLDTSKWVPPPYKEIYQNDQFVWSKPLCVINNKYMLEWGEAPVNFISLEALKKTIDLLKNKYQIIYNRPIKGQIVRDHMEFLDFGDYDMIKQFYPEVITMAQLYKNNSNLSFNTLSLMVFSNCNNFISVQGGNSVLASYFGGINIIYAKKGKELEVKSYENWYKEFSGCEIVHVNNDAELIAEIKKRYV